jgi:signal transduction histidine kinase/DNA-binding response OmpR family regulator
LSIRSKLIAAFISILVPLLLVGTLAYTNSKELVAQDQWVAHTQQVLGATQQFLRSLSDAESALRGYHLVPDPHFLTAYQELRTRLPGELATIRSLTADNARQQERIRRIAPLLADKLATMDHELSERQAGAPLTALLDELQVSRERMSAIAPEAAALIAEEGRLLAERQRDAHQQAEKTQWEILVGTFITLLVVVASAYGLSKGITVRLEQLSMSAKSFGGGEMDTRVTVNGADELAVLGTAFNGMAERLQARQAELETSRAELRDTNLELQSRNEEVERANHMKSQFLASMSHELRTPLNAILGFSELLEDQTPGPLNEKQKRFVGHVRTAARHLVQLINDILDLSKIEAGQLELQIESFPLYSVVPEVISLIRPLAMGKRVALEAIPPDADRAVLADRIRVKQVLYNLLSNAVKFTPEGGRVTLEILSKGDLPGITVTDTGVGIAKEQQEVIFDEFRQLGDDASKRQGTGLGLAITRRLVECQGGKISVKSEPGKGSRFTVEFPAGVATPTVKASAPTISPAAPALGRSANRPLVLVVDDDPLARSLLASFLIPEGFDVRETDSGEEALRLARELQPNAITLDVLMPVSGWQVLSELKKDPRTADIPVLVATIVDQKSAAFVLGAADYLLKPISRDTLVRALRRQLVPATEPHRILVVDDNLTDLQVSAELLASVGFMALQAPGGAEGLAMMRKERPNAVLLDLMMPDIDGFEVLRQMKEDKALQAIPVFVLTAKDLSNEEAEFLSRETQSLLSKAGPWKEDLLFRLRQTLIVKANGQSTC